MTFMQKLLKQAPVNVSRRGFLSGTGALVLSTTLPVRPSKAQEAEAAAGPAVPAFLEIHEDGTAKLLSPFIEGGQGIYTTFAQVVGEELDLAPENFSVEIAPAGPPYDVM